MGVGGDRRMDDVVGEGGSGYGLHDTNVMTVMTLFSLFLLLNMHLCVDAKVEKSTVYLPSPIVSAQLTS